MQGLLARLKSSQEPRSFDTGLLNGDDGLNGKQFININLVNYDDEEDGEDNAEEYVTRTLASALSGESSAGRESPRTPRTEDLLAIEAVMASNKYRQSKARRQLSSTSSKLTSRSSKTRGSRVSLNSVALSEREDLDTSGMDSDDDTVTTARSQIVNSAQLWAQFENAVKNIDNSDPDVFIKKPKPNFVSSETFQKVMVDMYGNTEYGNTKGYTLLKQKLGNMARSTALASKMLSSAVARGHENREREEMERELRAKEQANGEPSADDTNDDPTKTSAKRGWKIMKRQVHEQVMEQKTQTSKVKWNMISHTMKQMSNMDRARQDLYERYGIIPTTLADGRVICENRMLSERARMQLYGSPEGGRENKRPLSYQPPPTYMRGRSKTTMYNNYVADGRTNGYANKKLGKRRPMTAKSIY